MADVVVVAALEVVVGVVGEAALDMAHLHHTAAAVVVSVRHHTRLVVEGMYMPFVPSV